MATIDTSTDTASSMFGLHGVMAMGLYTVGAGIGLLAGFVVLLLAA